MLTIKITYRGKVVSATLNGYNESSDTYNVDVSVDGKPSIEYSADGRDVRSLNPFLKIGTSGKPLGRWS